MWSIKTSRASFNWLHYLRFFVGFCGETRGGEVRYISSHPAYLGWGNSRDTLYILYIC